MAIGITPERIIVRPPFSNLFAIDPEEQQNLKASIRLGGYDRRQPITVWKDGDGPGTNVLVEGHRRLAGVLALKRESPEIARRLETIPADRVPFKTEEDALMYAIRAQVSRRNAAPHELVGAVLAGLRALGLVGEAGRGKRSDLKRDALTGEEIAARFGVSRKTILRGQKLLRSGREDLIAQVRAGEIGLPRAVEICDKPEPAGSGESGEVEAGPGILGSAAQTAADVAEKLEDKKVAEALVASGSLGARRVANAVADSEARRRRDAKEAREQLGEASGMPLPAYVPKMIREIGAMSAAMRHLAGDVEQLPQDDQYVQTLARTVLDLHRASEDWLVALGQMPRRQGVERFEVIEGEATGGPARSA